MTMRGSSKHYTICEVLREINDLHQEQTEHDKIIRNKLALAEKMAKKMSYKLKEYNKNIYNDWWGKNRDYENDLNRRLSKNYCIGDANE
jgi:hypothetical protein